MPEIVKRADLHVHTRFSAWKHLRIIKPRDSYNDPLEVYEACRRLGMDFVPITDHDTVDGALDLLSRRPDLEPRVIIGEEVETWFPDTGQWVHVNVFGIDESDHNQIQHLKENVYDLVGWLRERGVFHVLNHPFQSYRVQKGALAFIEEILGLFDHFEVGNTTLSARHNRTVAEMLDYATALYTRKHGVGGSDAHHMRNVGMYCTEATVAEEGGWREWLESLSRGGGRAVGRTIGAGSLTANIYRIIGQYYLSLRDPEVRRHMRAENYVAAALLAPACIAGVPAFLNLGNSLRLEAVTLYLRLALRESLKPRRGVEPEEALEDPPG